MNIRQVRNVVVAVWISAVPMASRAATWYVAAPPAGDDTYAGNTGWGSPFATIQKGIDSANEGDDVLVSNGTYSISAQIAITNRSRLTVHSLNGPQSTTLRASSSGYRIVYIRGVTNIVLDGFTITGGNLNNYGAGIFVDGTNGTLGNTEAILRNCIVTNNTTQANSGGGIACGYNAVTLIRNCLVAGNYGGHVSGISGRNTGKTTIESTTVVRNNGGNAVYSEHSATTYGTNCIVYDNQGGNITAANGNWVYTCANPAPSGTGNTNANPQFFDIGSGYGLSLIGGDYRLRSTSPCLNIGTNVGWMGAATDIAGSTRILEDIVNLGAYESIIAALSVRFSGTPLAGLQPLPTVFTAVVGGTNTSSIGYRWDFNGDGSWDTAWQSSPVTTNPYPAGTFSAVLMVTNGAGEVWTETNANYILAAPSTLYVAPSGGNTSPYDTWAKAANSIASAITAAADGSTIIVSNGTYGITAEIALTKALTLRSLNGAAGTIIRRSSGACRIFNISAGATNWMIDGFTIKDGSVAGNGAGLQILNAGVVGTLQNCMIVSNSATGVSVGGGIACGGGAVTAIRNCLIASNSCNTHAAGISIRSGSGSAIIENCTFVSNLVTSTTNYYGYGGETGGGGPWIIRNAIFLADTINEIGTTPVTYSRIVGTAGAGNTTSDPKLITFKGLPYFPAFDSPCIDRGTNLSWSGSATDLTGRPRIKKGQVDMGAYEFWGSLGSIIQIQ